MKRRVPLALGLTLAATLMALVVGVAAKYAGLGKTDSPGDAKTVAPAIVRVAAAKPARKTLRRVVVEPGRLEAFEQTAIYSKLTAYVGKFHMDIGDLGEAGQPLAELWIPELKEEVHQKEAQLGQAKASVEQVTAAVAAAEAAVQTARAGIQEANAGMLRAQGKYERWKSEYNRIAGLAKTGVVDRQMADETLNEFNAAEATRGEVEARVSASGALLTERKANLGKANADLSVAQAAVKNAEADLGRVRALLEYTQIRMPYTGVVILRNINRGDFVLPANTGGKPLFVTARIDVIRVFVDVSEMDAPWVKPGAKGIVIVQSLGGRKIDGAVTRTSGALGPNRTLLAEIDVPNPQRTLQPGMYAIVEIAVHGRRDGLTLPLSAVIHEDGKAFCYCVEQGRLARRPIELGLRTAAEVEVVSGLDGGEIVVQSHVESLRADQRVEIAPSPTS
jgi:HlyD family secretion protein